MADTLSDKDLADMVMKKIEKFFDTGDESGNSIFDSFIKKHEALFDAECDALENENKLE